MLPPRYPVESDEAPPPFRRVLDEDYRVWTVRERVGDLVAYPDRRSLVFEAQHAMRRLWDYPADWHRLTDEELLRLSWGR